MSLANVPGVGDKRLRLDDAVNDLKRAKARNKIANRASGDGPERPERAVVGRRRRRRLGGRPSGARARFEPGFSSVGFVSSLSFSRRDEVTRPAISTRRREDLPTVDEPRPPLPPPRRRRPPAPPPPAPPPTRPRSPTRRPARRPPPSPRRSARAGPPPPSTRLGPRPAASPAPRSSRSPPRARGSASRTSALSSSICWRGARPWDTGGACRGRPW